MNDPHIPSASCTRREAVRRVADPLLALYGEREARQIALSVVSELTGSAPAAPSRGASAASSVDLPLRRPPVTTRWRLPLARKEVQIQSAVGLYAGIAVGFIAGKPLLSFRGQAASAAAAAARGALGQRKA